MGRLVVIDHISSHHNKHHYDYVDGRNCRIRLSRHYSKVTAFDLAMALRYFMAVL